MLLKQTDDQEEQKALLALQSLDKEALERMHSELLAPYNMDFKSMPLEVMRKVFTITTILRKQKGGPPRTKAPAMRDEDIF